MKLKGLTFWRFNLVNNNIKGSLMTFKYVSIREYMDDNGTKMMNLL